MIIDNLLSYSDAQALTGTAASTNIVDHGTPSPRSIGIGESLALVISVDVAADAANGDETYSAQLQTDTSSGFGSAVSVGQAITITRGDAAGTKYYMTLPPDASVKRYTRVNYTLGGTTPSVTVTAELVPVRLLQNDQYVASGYKVQ